MTSRLIEYAKNLELLFDDEINLHDYVSPYALFNAILTKAERTIIMDAGNPTGAGLGPTEVQAHTPLSHASEQLVTEIYALRDRIIGLGNRIEPYLRQADSPKKPQPIEEPDQMENSSVFVGSVYALAHEVRTTQGLVDSIVDRLEV